MNVLISGATGNLGSHLARSLINSPHQIRLLVHLRRPSSELVAAPNVSIVHGDLDAPKTLNKACREVDCVIHLAGVLFRPRPASFLKRTNIVYAKNLIDASLVEGVRKFILVSFPHVEGESTPDHPAKGVLEGHSNAIHAQTRLAAEKYLFEASDKKEIRPVVLRSGVIYGRDVKLSKAARWLLRYRLMAIWRKPTWVHLLSLPDLLHLVRVVMEKDDVSGIYNLCDDQPMLLQEVLDHLAIHWKYPKPRRLPKWAFSLTAIFSEVFATVFQTPSPLNRDILKMGMTSVVADISRMKQELAPRLIYPTLKEGIDLL